jgi:hypothetical protein
MKKILMFVSLFAAIINAQSFQIKQITNLNADCRNINCGGYNGYANNAAYYTFEVHKENSSNVYLGQYSPYSDSFTVITKVTDNNFMNINPKLLFSNDSIFIIYQTNMNGNWDIAYRVYFKNQLSSVYFIADSSVDEIEPVVMTINEVWAFSSNQNVAYIKGNSIFIRDVHIPNSVETEVFHGDDSTIYNQVSQESSDGFDLYYVAARKVINGKPSIVYKKHEYNNWGEESTLVNSGNCRNPKLHNINFGGPTLSYTTNDINGESNIILIQELSQPIDTLKLFDYPLYNYDNFLAQVPLMITKKRDFYSYIPYTYTASRSDSLFIRMNKLDGLYAQQDTLVNTKVFNNNLYLGSFGTINGNEIYYTIWEDSIAGHVQLFGKRYLYPIGGVNDNYSPSSFALYQNYPNPFNPGTVINFKLLHHDKVTLAVYDLMGRQVCTLINEDKSAGNYSINFDSRKFNLSSGVYFYKLVTGGNSQVKKMILLK